MSKSTLEYLKAFQVAFGIIAVLSLIFNEGDFGLAVLTFCMGGVWVTTALLYFQPNFKTYQESDILDENFNEDERV